MTEGPDAARGASRGSAVTTAIAGLGFFFVLASYFVIRPVRDQLSAAVGSTGLWRFWLATLVIMLLLTPVFGYLVSRYSRQRFVPIVYGVFALALVAFIPLFARQADLDPALLGTVFYVFASVFNLFVVSLYWSVLADLLDPATARAQFPLIAMAGSLGAIAGPAATSTMVGVLGVPPLLGVSAALLIAGCGMLLWLGRRNSGVVRANAHEAVDTPVGGSIWAGLLQVFGTQFLRRMAILMLLADTVGTVAYALMADHVGALHAGYEARTAFYARLDLATNVLQLVLQATLTRWLLMRHGAGLTLLVAGVLNVIVLLGVAIVGDAALVAMLIMTRSGAYGISKPAMDSLYARAPREARFKGKNFIDTAVWRFGDVMVAGLLAGLRSAGASLGGIAALCAVGAAAFAAVGWTTGRSKELVDDDSRTS